MNNIEDSFAEELPWGRVQDNDYEAACRACEIDITIPDRHTHATLLAALELDRTGNGAPGRALVVPVRVGDTEL